jgi:SpoVK/Ycf46/Vps4 family AAA+-type ATPase
MPRGTSIRPFDGPDASIASCLFRPRPAGAGSDPPGALPGKPVQNIDYEHLAKKTDYFSGADLRAVLDLAVESKLREAMKAGTPRPLTTKDLVTVAAALRPSTRDWFATARNYALYSNQGGIYDDILKHLKLG